MDKELVYYPQYYKDFKCSMGACRHTCCSGWEIDIDPESLERFEAAGITDICKDGTAHFTLREDMNCPFLQGDGLCRMIIEHGEDFLCDICRDHPRFRNFWTGRVETGLGLACEEAAKLILLSKEPMRLIPGDDAGPAAPAASGDEADLPEEPELPQDEQYLMDLRGKLLRQAGANPDHMAARLSEYFIFRHLADALYDGRLEGRMRFIEYCINSVMDGWDALSDPSDEDLIDIAREFSLRVEYNEERKEKLIASFEEQQRL